MRILNKTILLTITALSTLAVAPGSMAASGGNSPFPPPSNGNTAVVKAIHTLGNEISALATAGVKTVNHAMYQLDKNLPGTMQANTANSTATAQVKIQTTIDTQNHIQFSLSSFPDKMVNISASNGQATLVAARNKKRNAVMNNLTMNTPASDTLYLNSFIAKAAATLRGMNGYNVGKPTVNNDDYFNFATLLNHNAYNSQQQVAAQEYITYLTKQYNPISSGLDLQQLKNNLNKLSPSKAAQALKKLISSQPYEKYQLAVRSQMAGSSLILSNFQSMAAERTPIEKTTADPTLAALSKTMGLTPQNITITLANGKKEKVIAYASPLQIANYTARHRIDNPQWYQQVATASPATVQRKTLIVLSEMEAQMQQAHMDREKMLGTMSYVGLQISETNQQLLKLKTRDVNQKIKDIGKTNKQIQAEKNKNNYMTAKQAQDLNNKNAAAKSRGKAGEQGNQ